VAWDSQLRYEISVPNQQGGGMFSRLVSSVTSGEGIVLRFSGRGQVVICSRNRNAFSSWVRGGASSS
jgi:uncharacterized protein (AIM24 family)